jgi:PadR family transcriptional regulator, regulatory protein AphA
MARDSRSQYALLGLLGLKPMSGYEIKKTTEDTTSPFWHESYGNVYPTLQKLLQSGWIESVQQSQNNGRQRQRYRLTASGRAHLLQWLEEESQPQRPRDTLLLQSFFQAYSTPEVFQKKRHQESSHLKEQIKKTRKTQHSMRTNYPKHPHLHAWLMTLDASIMQWEARLAWCQQGVHTAEQPLPEPKKPLTA